MYKVLVPLDLDEQRARTQAEFVASLPDAASSVEVTLLFVFGEDDEELPDELKRFKSAERVGSVRRCSERLDEVGVTYSIMDESGDPADIITNTAEDLAPDMIVLGGRKRSPIGKAIFGSVAQSVILNSDHPVVVTGTRVE